MSCSFSDRRDPLKLPAVYNINGQPLFPNGDSSKVPANTVVDLQRFQNDVAAITPGHEAQLYQCLLHRTQLSQRLHRHLDFGPRSRYWRRHSKRRLRRHRGSALTQAFFRPTDMREPIPHFAPFTQFNAAGQGIGGYGPEPMMSPLRTRPTTDCRAV